MEHIGSVSYVRSCGLVRKLFLCAVLDEVVALMAIAVAAAVVVVCQ